MLILPSIASANQADLKGEIAKLGNHPYLHFDIEDGNFVPNITFGMKTVKALRPLTAANFDAHLMVTDPMDYIPALLKLNFKAIAFHWESVGYPMIAINAIRDGGAKAGIALNPRTSADTILDYLSVADYVLVMTSEPDGHGDCFQPNVIAKIKRLHDVAPDLPIVADGGIYDQLLPLVRDAGVNITVMGRAVFSAEEPLRAIEKYSHM